MWVHTYTYIYIDNIIIYIHTIDLVCVVFVS